MRPARHHIRSGFTLVELMVVVAVMTIVSGTVLTTFLCLNRAATAVTGYRAVHAGARRALASIADDIRQARTVAVPAPGALLLTMQGAQAARPVRYVLDREVVRRQDGDSSRALCAGVAAMRVELMTREGGPASDAGSAALVRTTLDLIEARGAARSTNTFSLVTAMRNRGSP